MRRIDAGCWRQPGVQGRGGLTEPGPKWVTCGPACTPTSRFGALGLHSEDMCDILTQQYSGGFFASPSIW